MFRRVNPRMQLASRTFSLNELVQAPTCNVCREKTSLSTIEPYAIGDSFWEEWVFECDCGTVAKRPRRLSPIR